MFKNSWSRWLETARGIQNISANLLRRGHRRRHTNWNPIESLESRVVLIGSPLKVGFEAGVLFLTGDNDPEVFDPLTGEGESSELVGVTSGPNSTVITLGGAVHTVLSQVNQNTLTEIRFNGKTGKNTLSFSGPNALMRILLSEVESLRLFSQNTTVIADRSLRLDSSTVTGILDVSTEAGEITQAGKLVVSGEAAFSAEEGAANITLATKGNSFGSLRLVGDEVTVVEVNATDLGTSTVGNFVLKSGGAITDSGTLTVGGDLTLSTPNLEIQLDELDSTFAGTVTLKGSDITLVDSDANGVELGKIAASGFFDLTAAGPVTQVGSIAVGGLMTIHAEEHDVTLTSGADGTLVNNFGSLSLFADHVAIIERSGTNFATGSMTSLEMTSGGAVSDTGPITIAETTTLNAMGRAVTLDEPESMFVGAMTIIATSISVTNKAPTLLGSITARGVFHLTSAGDVTQTEDSLLGIIGRMTINAFDDSDQFDITLENSGNKFGSVSLYGNDASLVEFDATNLFHTNLHNLSLLSGGGVADSGTLTISGETQITATGKVITLDSPESSFAEDLALVGSNVTLVNPEATSLGTITASGNLRVISSGDVTQSGTLKVGGRLTVTAAEQDITLEDTENQFGSVSLFGRDVSLREKNSTNLYTSTITGTFELTSGGSITDSGVLTVQGKMTLDVSSVAGNNITLDAAGSTFGGSVILLGKNILLRSTSSLDLGFIEATGTLTIFSASDITDSNPTGVVSPDPVLSAVGAVRIHAVGTLTLDEERSFPAASVTLLGEAGTNV